jgi:hypothetical protein
MKRIAAIALLATTASAFNAFGAAKKAAPKKPVRLREPWHFPSTTVSVCYS